MGTESPGTPGAAAETEGGDGAECAEEVVGGGGEDEEDKECGGLIGFVAPSPIYPPTYLLFLTLPALLYISTRIP